MNDQAWCRFLVSQTIRPGMRVLDVGANEGMFTSAFIRAGAEVWAIEPSAASCETLRRTGAHVLPYAVGAQNGLSGFWHSHNNAKHHSCYRDALPQPHLGVEMVVTMRTLDDLMATGELPPAFDFVKVDIQGAEGPMLSQASRLLASDAAWMLELWPYGLACAGWTVEQVIDRLAGSTPYNISQSGDTIAPWSWAQVRDAAARQEPQTALNLGFAKPDSPIGQIWQGLAQAVA